MNYLELCNQVLLYTNEPALTQATFTSARGIQQTVKTAVNNAIDDVINYEMEWPFLKASASVNLIPGKYIYDLPASFRNIDYESFLVRHPEKLTNNLFVSDIASWTDTSSGTGSAAYNSGGNGRARLTGDGTNAGGLEQAISLVVGRRYRITVHFLNNDLNVTLGTSTGNTSLLDTDFVLTEAGGGTTKEYEFAATAATTYLGIYNTSTTYTDVEFVSVREASSSHFLQRINYDTFRRKFYATADSFRSSAWHVPCFVFPTQNDDNFGVYPVPDDYYQLVYDYFTTATLLTDYDDIPIIPTRYQHVIVSRARYYILSSRSDPVFADRANKEFELGIQRMRTELINVNQEMTFG